MQKVFHFDSASEPYLADAAVLSCFDQRIQQVVNKFLRRRGILRPDMIVVAGGAKTLASPRNDFERDFVLEQVRTSVLLHGPGEHISSAILIAVPREDWRRSKLTIGLNESIIVRSYRKRRGF